jgi:hypothetical protein
MRKPEMRLLILQIGPGVFEFSTFPQATTQDGIDEPALGAKSKRTGQFD